MMCYSTYFLNSFLSVYFCSVNETLVAATKEIGLEVNADKTKYMIMSRDQKAGRGHSMKIDNSPI